MLANYALKLLISSTGRAANTTAVFSRRSIAHVACHRTIAAPSHPFKKNPNANSSDRTSLFASFATSNTRTITTHCYGRSSNSLIVQEFTTIFAASALTTNRGFKSLKESAVQVKDLKRSNTIKKPKKVYECSNCGAQTPQWTGKCNECGSWSTIHETIIDAAADHTKLANHRTSNSRTPLSSSTTYYGGAMDPVRIHEVKDSSVPRYTTGISEFDRAMGGSLVCGSLILIGGEPGVGKSTLLFQVCEALSASMGGSALYISGEESQQQLSIRAKRMGLKSEDFYLLCETCFESILEKYNQVQSKVIVVDSIQTMYTTDLPNAPGNTAQLREVCDKFLGLAKRTNSIIFLIGHVTKEGLIAGPRVLEHMVDVVLYFDNYKRDQYRLLRNYKNRFGTTNDIGVFEISNYGLKSVDQPSKVFLEERPHGEPGSVITTALEGSRSLLIEVQALLSWKAQRMPKQRTLGLDMNRLWMISAVIERKLGIALGARDIFVNIVGGIKVDDPAIDLSICAAIVSSAIKVPVEADSVFFGEVGLTGEVRSVSQAESRVKECIKMGIKKIYLPRANYFQLKQTFKNEQVQWIPVENLDALVQKAFNGFSIAEHKKKKQQLNMMKQRQLQTHAAAAAAVLGSTAADEPMFYPDEEYEELPVVKRDEDEDNDNDEEDADMVGHSNVTAGYEDVNLGARM